LTVQLLGIVNNLGNFYRKQGRLDEAEGMFWRALAGREKVHGNEALTVPLLDSIYNLGLLYHEQGRLDEAEGMHKRALAGFREMYGPSHKKLRYSDTARSTLKQQTSSLNTQLNTPGRRADKKGPRNPSYGDGAPLQECHQLPAAVSKQHKKAQRQQRNTVSGISACHQDRSNYSI
jgi:tetratricopeptide (TPR) repeat protein